MASFNKVILVGNLTRDPEVRYIPSGTAVTDIGLAVNHTWFDKQANQRREEATFVDITLWGRTAEIAGEYLSKGRSVLIEGRLQMDQWEDKNTGQKRSKLKVVGENMTMLGSGPQGGGPQGGGSQGGGNRGRQAAPSSMGSANEEPSPADSFYDAPGGDIPEDEVPF